MSGWIYSFCGIVMRRNLKCVLVNDLPNEIREQVLVGIDISKRYWRFLPIGLRNEGRNLRSLIPTWVNWDWCTYRIGVLFFVVFICLLEILITEIVEGVRSNQKCLRPNTNELSCEEEVGNLMKRCWTEDPADRPDFTTLKAAIRKLNK